MVLVKRYRLGGYGEILARIAALDLPATCTSVEVIDGLISNRQVASQRLKVGVAAIGFHVTAAVADILYLVVR